MRVKVCLFLPLARYGSARLFSHPRSVCPSYVLVWQCNCNASLILWGGFTGIPVWGRGIRPSSQSICRLSQSCTLLPSLPLSPNHSLCCQMQQNITLSFSSAPASLCFFEQRHISQSVLQMTDSEMRHLFPQFWNTGKCFTTDCSWIWHLKLRCNRPFHLTFSH